MNHQLLLVAVTAPLFDWVTLVVLEFDADAAPVVLDAVELAVFEPELVLLTVPPELPVVLPLDPGPLSMFPSFAEASLPWKLSLAPLTDDFVLFPPLFALALWCVETCDNWTIAATAMGGRLSSVSGDEMLFVAAAAPEFSF
jgi:hypothetical protein